MTADCHATGEFAGQPTGWWEPLIGPGRAIDTDRYFVVCPNLIGGCYGTTGPRFPAIAGDPYLDEFPLLTPRDMMRVQKLFVEQLGIRKLALAIGPSMGGTSPHQIGLNWLQRRGIELDFTENEQVATQGQMVARGVGMLSYRSPVGLEEKFGREYDLDIFMKQGTKGLDVTDISVHKKNGEARYDWVEKEGVWSKQEK